MRADLFAADRRGLPAGRPGIAFSLAGWSPWHTSPVHDARNPVEERAAESHRRIAERIRRDPTVIAEAVARVERRLGAEPGRPDPALCEWLDVLRLLDPGQIANFIEAETPRARRLRSSSPLMWLAR